MPANLLITLGCSWTYGVGVNYQSGMSLKDYTKTAWDQTLCDQLSFRGQLSSKFNLDNINFSVGGSSNQKQFRLATKFFSSKNFHDLQKKYKNIIVLWGITSTARTEMYDLAEEKMINFFLTAKTPPIAKQLLKYTYNHDNEVEQLSNLIVFWNLHFKNCRVHNFWFDTFNHHNYFFNHAFSVDNIDFDINAFRNKYNALSGPDWPSWDRLIQADMNLVPLRVVKEIYRIFPWFGNVLRNRRLTRATNFINDSYPRDLASYLALKNGWQHIQDTYHFSDWKVDSKKIDYLTNIGLLNPWSHHPTAESHQIIAKLFEPHIVSVLESNTTDRFKYSDYG
jgi:hypothetical protein